MYPLWGFPIKGRMTIPTCGDLHTAGCVTRRMKEKSPRKITIWKWLHWHEKQCIYACIWTILNINVIIASWFQTDALIEWLCRSYGWHVSLSIWKCVSQAHPWKGHGFFLYPALIERCILHSVLLCRPCMSIVKSATSLIRVECNELPGSMAATTFPICGRKPLRFGQGKQFSIH